MLITFSWSIGWINALSLETHAHRAIVAIVFHPDRVGVLPIYLAGLKGFSFLALSATNLCLQANRYPGASMRCSNIDMG